MLQQRAMTRGVDFQIDCPVDLPDVYCDADMVGRIITNLAINAVKSAARKAECDCGRS